MGKWLKVILPLVVTLILAVSIKNEFLYFLFGFEIMLVAAAWIQVIYMAGKLHARIILPEQTVTKGGRFLVKVWIENNSRFPVSALMLRLAVRSFPDPEQLLLKGKLMLAPCEAGTLCFELDCSHVGYLEFAIDRMIVSDYLGIINWKCKMPASKSEALYVLPEIIRSARMVPEVFRSELSLDGEQDRKGNTDLDISEIREYRPGDSWKQIHWKLSARLDDIMARDLTDPVERFRCVYLDLKESDSGIKVRNDPEQWDFFVQTVAEVSSSFIVRQIKHVFIWQEKQGHCLRFPVSDEDSMCVMLMALLRTDTCTDGADLHLSEETDRNGTEETWFEIDLQGNIKCSVGTGC